MGRCRACCTVLIVLVAVVAGIGMYLRKSFDDYEDGTPLGAAVMRTIETLHQPASERIINDPFAVQLLPASRDRPGVRILQFALEKFSSALELLVAMKPGGESLLLWLGACRTRLIDDVLEAALETGAKQVVVLGAGFDSRGIRLSRSSVDFIEVDRPQVQQQKAQSLARLAKGPRARMVSVDFATEKLEDKLQASGFRKDVKAVFVMEGVAQYIPRSGLLDTLAFVGGLKNATITFTYVHRDTFDNPSALNESMPIGAIEDMIQKFKIAREPWTTGYRPEEFPKLLSGVGLHLSADDGWQECMDRHLVPKGRSGVPLKMERLVTAATTTGARP